MGPGEGAKFNCKMCKNAETNWPLVIWLSVLSAVGIIYLAHVACNTCYEILKLTLAYKFGIFINLTYVNSYHMSSSTAVTVFIDWTNLERYWIKFIFDELLMK